MKQTLKINNLFRYATSELSQDAVICWLLSHITALGWNEDAQLRDCAIMLLNKILQTRNAFWTEDMRITKIDKQYKNIDVLVQIADLYIIIEDKTFTSPHDDQINRYKKTLVDEGKAPKILSVYTIKLKNSPRPRKIWWFDILSSDDLKRIGLDEQCADELYLQIENDIIAVKYTINPEKNPNAKKATAIRWKLYDYFHQQLGDAFQKKSFRPGNFMTVGYVKYDETNYTEKLIKMRNALIGLLTNGRLI